MPCNADIKSCQRKRACALPVWEMRVFANCRGIAVWANRIDLLAGSHGGMPFEVRVGAFQAQGMPCKIYTSLFGAGSS